MLEVGSITAYRSAMRGTMALFYIVEVLPSFGIIIFDDGEFHQRGQASFESFSNDLLVTNIFVL